MCLMAENVKTLCKLEVGVVDDGEGVRALR